MAATNKDLSQKLDDNARRGDLLGIASLLALGADARNQASMSSTQAFRPPSLPARLLIPSSKKHGPRVAGGALHRRMGRSRPCATLEPLGPYAHPPAF